MHISTHVSCHKMTGLLAIGLIIPYSSADFEEKYINGRGQVEQALMP